jgi:hypothetical protein
MPERMLAGLQKQDVALVEQADPLLPGDVQEIGRLLCRDLAADRHDGDRVAACHDLGHALEDVEDALREEIVSPLVQRAGTWARAPSATGPLGSDEIGCAR